MAPSLRVVSLAQRVGRARSVGVSVLVLLSHCAFFYAQWGGQNEDCGFQDPKTLVLVGCPTDHVAFSGLLAGVLEVHAEYDAGAIAGAAVDTLTTEMCYAKGLYAECPAGRQSQIMKVNESTQETVCTLLECSGANINLPVLHVSYWYSLVHLWMQPGPTDPPGCNIFHDPEHCHTSSYPGQLPAAALFAFSFIWPHAKLILLHLFFYLPLSPGVRRNGLFWFGFFGKWSLADVLVMCTVIGLFNLDVDLTALGLWAHLEDNDFPSLCATLLCRGNGTSANSTGAAELVTSAELVTGAVTGASHHYLSTASSSLTSSSLTSSSLMVDGGGVSRSSLSGAFSFNCSELCDVAEAVLREVLTPTNLPASRVTASLRILGLGAMYAFCIAVCLSLSVGVWVEHLDDELREELIDEALIGVGGRMAGGADLKPDLFSANVPSRRPPFAPRDRHLLEQGAAECEALQASNGLHLQLLSRDRQSNVPLAHAEPPPPPSLPPPSLPPPSLPPPSLPATLPHQTDEGSSGEGSSGEGRSGEGRSVYKEDGHVRVGSRYGYDVRLHLLHISLLLALLSVLLQYVFAPAFSRVLRGSLPTLLKQAGLDFDIKLALWELPRLTAMAGGLDLLMAATFIVFILAGPILRVLSLLALLLLPMSADRQRTVYLWSRRLASYTAVECMLIATPLIGMAFGPMSEALLNDDVLPLCATLNDIYNPPLPDKEHDVCLRIDVEPAAGYWFNVASTVLMLLAGFDGSFTSKYIHRMLYPHDPHPPPSCIECCAKTTAVPWSHDPPLVSAAPQWQLRVERPDGDPLTPPAPTDAN